MNTVVTENIGNARDITLLGGRLQLENGYLTLGEKDLLYDDTSYYYFSSPSSRDEFFNALRRHYVKNGQSQVFDGAKVDYRLKYIPVLVCGSRILALNNEVDYFITDNFFEKPHVWLSNWDNMIAPVANGCLQGTERSLLPIKLSYREISYLAPSLKLPLPKQLKIVLMPFHTATITGKHREYRAAQIAVRNAELVCDYPKYSDATFSAMTHVLFLLAIYGACAAFVLCNTDTEQFLPLVKSYAKWGFNHFFINDLDEIFGSYIPFLYLGNIVGVIVEIILAIIVVILIFGVIPAVALIVPMIVSSILAFCTIWIHRIYLEIRKGMLFNKSVRSVLQATR